MSKYLKNWNPRAVESAVSGKLIQRMDEVGAFVASQARARAPRDTGTLRENITHEVHARGNHVEAVVGVRKKVFWAWFMEMGTRKGVRARPFLRPAVWQNRATILRILGGGGGTVKTASYGSAMKAGASAVRKVAGKFGVRVPSLPSLPKMPSLPALPKAPNIRAAGNAYLRKLRRW